MDCLRQPALAASPGQVQVRDYELNEGLQTALVNRADREQRPAEEIQAELVAAGLDHLDISDRLRETWEHLSPRECDVTAYTCLGYTNQQMAKEMWVSPHTVKEYMRSAQVKWKVHNKSELRLLLAQWDFSAWGEHPGTGAWGEHPGTGAWGEHPGTGAWGPKAQD